MFKTARGLLYFLTTALIVCAQTDSIVATVNCEAIPAGPARTDCYITQSRLGGAKAAVAGSSARVEADRATLQKVTGKPVKGKPRRKARVPKGTGN
jgi:hypothetical protein